MTKIQPIDGANDANKNDGKWVGKFFTPVVGKRYRLPINACNYGPHRGKAGVCVRFHQTDFGFCWAYIKFDHSGETHAIRTAYLVDMEGNQGVLEEKIESHLTPAQMFANVWIGDDNSGTIQITGAR
jgi:hypothetical protein